MNLTVAVTKRLSAFALDVDLGLPGPGIKALVGPSGAGKSTLLRLIAGLERPDTGFVHFRGTVWSDVQLGIHLPPWQRPVGMVVQDFDLFRHLTLLDNVLFAAADHALAEHLMRQLDIWELRRAWPHQVSGGQRQRCAICQALVRRPRLLLLDEPFSALDPVTRRSLGALLTEISRDMAIPMLLVTHNLQEALTLADTVVSLVEGRLFPGWLEQRIEEMERDVALNWALFRSGRGLGGKAA